MIGNHNIWRRLQDHEEVPPPEVRSRLLQWLSEEKEKENHLLADIFKDLGEHEIHPPLPVQATVKNMVYNTGKPLASPAKNIRRRNLAVAVCVLFLFAAWGIYASIHFSKTPASVVQAARKKNPDNEQMNTAANGKVLTDSSIVANRMSRTQVRYEPFRKMRTGGQQLLLEENDLLFTFANFKFNEVPLFLSSDRVGDVPVHLDEYTHIIISEKMAAMLKEMYQVKSNGKPTRKSRKSRERLEKWKKEEAIFFDKGRKNPLDPIDMADFIFK